MGKIISASDAVGLIPAGATIMVGGFGLVGAPLTLIDALIDAGIGDLTVISNNLGEPGLGLGRLLNAGQVRRAIGSYFTSNPDVVHAAHCGTLDVEVLPQGTLAEAIRAGGAGLGGFFTPTGAGTVLAVGRETRAFNGREHVFQPAIRADVALIRAHRADELGNLEYRMTARNFNPHMAMAAPLVIAEIGEVVPTGALDPETIGTPHVLVHRLVVAPLDASRLGSSSAAVRPEPSPVERRIAARARLEIRRGDVVNLGIGMPTLVADLIAAGDGIAVQTENGLLGVGPPPPDGGDGMRFPVDAGKRPVTALPGASYWDSADSFALIRSGRVDVAIMGALQVDASGGVANWSIPGGRQLGVGGAMDLARGARRLVIVMSHSSRGGEPKIVERCTLPLTATSVVDTIITDLGVFRIVEGRLVLHEIALESDLPTVRRATGAVFDVSRDLSIMPVSDSAPE